MSLRAHTHRAAHNRRLRADASASLPVGVRARADWRELADKARSAAAFSLASDDAELVLHFAHLTARAERHGDAPFENATDRLIAAALRLLCRAWLDRAAETRGDLGPVLGEAARLVDQLLTDELTRSAQGWQRRMGGD